MSSSTLSFPPGQLPAKYKHAVFFGVTGAWSEANAARFRAALERHVNSPAARQIKGTFRGRPVMHYIDPRLSGSPSGPLQGRLVITLGRGGIGSGVGWSQSLEGFPVHQVGPHPSGESGQAEDRLLAGVSRLEQQEDDQRDGDLDAHGVFTGAQKMVDLQRLLGPTEEQLDIPYVMPLIV